MTAPNFTIREAKPSDARPLNRYIRRIYGDSAHLITRPDEFRTTPFRQRWWIAGKQANPLETCLVALDDGATIAGMLDSWTDTRARVRHVTSFAMSVDPARQRRGIGEALLRTFIDWIEAHPTLEKIELHVHADNRAARALYEKLGFAQEGTRSGAVRYEDGRTVDDVIMGLWPTGRHLDKDV